jgi:RNA recognition motif-containing protein
MVEKLLVPVEDGSNEHKRAQLRELAEINGTLKSYSGCNLCGHLGHKQVACPKKVSLQRAKVDTTNDQNLCFELGTGKTAVSMEKSGSVIPRKSIQPLGSTDNYMSLLSQAGGLEHPQNGNAGIGPEVMRVSMETRGSELPIQSSQPPGFTDNYMSWLARGLEHLENGNAGIVPGKVSVEKGGSGLPRQSTQPVGLTDTYVSWLAGGLEQPEKVNAALVPQIRKASIEKSGSELTSQSTQSRGLTDNPGKEIDHSNVYVGYMPFTMDEEQLIKLFSSFGRIVKVVVIRDYANGSSKGYGFVKFCDNHCASQAIARMNGYRLEGKTLRVRVAGLAPSHSEVGSAECLYNFDKQPPGFPVHSGDYAQPSWSPSTRPVSSSSYNPYSDNNCSGIASHSVSSLQGGTFNSLPATDNHGKEIDHSDVYVGNMPPTMDEEQLIKLFSSFGRIVKVNVIRDYVKGSCKGYCFVKFCDNHCAAQAIAHMNGYRLEGQNLVVRVAGLAPSHSQVGPAECLYNFDKQPPRLPVHSGDYAQPSWSPSIRPVSSSPYNPYSDNNCSGIASHSVSSLQGGTFNSLPATSYFPYGLYQMPLPSAESSSVMQGPPRSQQVQGNVHDSSMSKLNVHSADAMSHFSPNQARISTYHRYAPPSIPLGSAYSESPSRGSLMGGLGTLPRSSSLLSSGHEKKAVELEYERFLSEMGPRHENI